MRWSLWVAALAVAAAVAAAAQASTSPAPGTTGPPTTTTTSHPSSYAHEVRFSGYNQTAVTADWEPGACDGTTHLEVRADGETAWRRLPADPPVRVEGLRPGTIHQVRLGLGCAGSQPVYSCFHTPPGFEWCSADHPTSGPRTQTTTLPPGVARIANVTLLARSGHEAVLAWDLSALGCRDESTVVGLHLVESPVGAFYPPVASGDAFVPGLGRREAAFEGLVSSGAYLARFDFHGECPGQAVARLGDYCFQTRPAPMACAPGQWPGAGNLTLAAGPSTSPSPSSGAADGAGGEPGGPGADGAAGTSTTAALGGASTETVRSAAAGLAALAALAGAAWTVRRRLP
jgi:hypothetical protein